MFRTLATSLALGLALIATPALARDTLSLNIPAVSDDALRVAPASSITAPTMLAAQALPDFGDVDTSSTEKLIGSILGIILIAAWQFLRRKELADADLRAKESQRFDLVRMGMDVAYLVVSEASRMTETKLDDKAALGLAAFRDYLKTHGLFPTAEEEARALLAFKAKHGAEKLAEDISAVAGAAALGASAALAPAVAGSNEVRAVPSMPLGAR